MKTELYHFYLDEGGVLGDCKYAILNHKKRITKDSNSIFYYYIGRMPINTIERYLQLFHRVFPNCKILPHGIQPYITEELLKQYGT